MFGEDSTQDNVYAETQPLIRSVLDGAGRSARCRQIMLLLIMASHHAATVLTAVHCVFLCAGYNVCIFAYGQTGSGEATLRPDSPLQLLWVACPWRLLESRTGVHASTSAT